MSAKLGFARAVILSERAGLSGRWAVALNVPAVVALRVICDELNERRAFRVLVARSIARRSPWFRAAERERQQRLAI